MQTLPAALAGLAAYPQFILYKLVPSTSRPGKTDKHPINWATGWKHDPTDPLGWTTFDNAVAAMATHKADGVGFVFTEADPFFFLDIDNALSDAGQWSELAASLCAAFPGAAIEVSSSGRGLHIFGSGQAPPHGCKNTALGLELYTSDRFVALTGAGAVGDCRADMSVVLPWLVSNYFPVGSGSGNARPTEWSTEPRADWRGPNDDADLLRRMLQSRSAASLFGNKASFADLWERNVEALAKAYPGDPYGESEADAALASHLAFWTGCNMERMLDFMQRSGLKRDKYDRGDYLEKFTIPAAVANCSAVLQDKPVVAPGADTMAPSPTLSTSASATAPSKLREGKAFLGPEDQIEYFAGCVYIKDQHRVFTPSGAILKPEQFKTVYGGRSFVMDSGNEKTSRNAWEAFTESSVNACPTADFSQFRPELAPGAITRDEGQTFVNTYVPVSTERAAGDVSRFLRHLALLLPVQRDRDILLAYLAACVQHVGVKFQWCPLIQGVEGNGKTLFSRCVEAALGRRYTHWPRADQIAAKFNAWQENKLLIAVEDIYLPEDRGEVLEVLKPMITNNRLAIENKGVDQRIAWICCNFILNSNHKDALRKTRNDRRFANFYCAQQHADDLTRDGMQGNYFPSLYQWLNGGGYAAVSEYLATYAIPAELNPAGECQRAPITSSTEEAIGASIGGIEQEIMEAIEAGTPGFIGGWISTHAVARLLDKIGRSRVLTHRKREQLLVDMGYIKHPGLDGGRVNNIVAPDSSKPVLYVKARSIQAGIVGAAAIAAAYSKAQTGGIEFGVRAA